MDAQNASGNTPLHVCAVNNQEASTRMLLFRGAQRDALNYANQTPYQVWFHTTFTTFVYFDMKLNHYGRGIPSIFRNKK